jgi:EAL domain-containing protein (putative c-di-GMP-specific phosphodiesterase class I)/DNA-binding NarL/FixJ family response regulator
MQQKRVLVADDDDAVVDVLRALIQSQSDLRLIGSANDTEHAIQLAVSEQPDVALIDVRMPGGGGVRAAREISRRCPRTRVIALTAHEDEATVIAMMAAGANAYVPKGESTERILREIHRLNHLMPVATEDDADGVWSADASARRGTPRTPGDRRREQQRRVRDVLDAGAISTAPRSIFDVRTGAVAGVLARTRVARLPMRGGDAWLAEADAVGLLEEFETAVLQAAERDTGMLPSSAFLMVHVSPATIITAGYREALRDLGCERIALEITERAHVDDYTPLNDALAPLRHEGLRLGVCDVGAGLASLRHVAMLAPDLVSLDTALTDGVQHDGARHAVVAALATRATQLGAKTIAQGVDSIDQLAELTGLGVNLAEGSAPEQLGHLPVEGVSDGFSSRLSRADVS